MRLLRRRQSGTGEKDDTRLVGEILADRLDAGIPHLKPEGSVNSESRILIANLIQSIPARKLPRTSADGPRFSVGQPLHKEIVHSVSGAILRGSSAAFNDDRGNGEIVDMVVLVPLHLHIKVTVISDHGNKDEMAHIGYSADAIPIAGSLNEELSVKVYFIIGIRLINRGAPNGCPGDFAQALRHRIASVQKIIGVLPLPLSNGDILA